MGNESSILLLKNYLTRSNNIFRNEDHYYFKRRQGTINIPISLIDNAYGIEYVMKRMIISNYKVCYSDLWLKKVRAIDTKTFYERLRQVE